MTPQEISSLHSQAMHWASEACAAEFRGDTVLAKELYFAAFTLEREAALATCEIPNSEPSRSILLRSAASLALDCRENREAERLIAQSLSGDPPQEIADELRDLLQTVYLARHLETKGLVLDRLEVQLSLSGDAVGHGLIESALFLPRADALEKLLLRTVERRKGVPFREHGRPKRAILENFEPLFSVPRAASFAISVRVGKPSPQRFLDFPDLVLPEDIVADVLESLDYFREGKQRDLRQHIEEESYFNNFVALAKKLAPDGERIRSVGLTSRRGDNEQVVALTGPPLAVWQRRTATDDDAGRSEVFVGRLRAADETSRLGDRPAFVLEDDNGVESPRIHVRPGELLDIVRPNWGSVVEVRADFTKRSGWLMQDIKPLDTSDD